MITNESVVQELERIDRRTIDGLRAGDERSLREAQNEQRRTSPDSGTKVDLPPDVISIFKEDDKGIGVLARKYEEEMANYVQSLADGGGSNKEEVKEKLKEFDEKALGDLNNVFEASRAKLATAAAKHPEIKEEILKRREKENEGVLNTMSALIDAVGKVSPLTADAIKKVFEEKIKELDKFYKEYVY
ncbi:hypothetical protein AB0467_28600 [Streptomyces sp. NPDC052095]|uniref:hypothetical protein n=1 Tax=unclassified Streptomyces TaxID=2593676 RepID=UPI00344D8525